MAWRRLVGPLFALTLAFAVGAVANAEQPPSTSEDAKTVAGPADSIASDEEAARIISFANEARAELERGYYGQGRTLLENVKRYGETWKLAPAPQVGGRKTARGRLEPAKGLFSEAEARDLTAALDGMDKALAEMIDKYRALEKYMSDDSIKDDGETGIKLARAIQAKGAEFMKAREGWLLTADNRAARAEERLLRAHPLKRQILDARKILNAINEIGDLTRADDAATMIRQTAAGLDGLIADASAPPFAAAPSLERLYRDFLKKTTAYRQILDRGLREGLGSTQRREIAAAARECAASYNKFAKAVNGAD